MVGVGDFFTGILKGDFLIKTNSIKNWRVIFTVLGMSIVMITCAHKTDEKVMRKAALIKQIKALKAEYVDSATKITRLRMESTIRLKVKEQGLESSKEPPVKIIVRNK